MPAGTSTRVEHLIVVSIDGGVCPGCRSYGFNHSILVIGPQASAASLSLEGRAGGSTETGKGFLDLHDLVAVESDKGDLPGRLTVNPIL